MESIIGFLPREEEGKIAEEIVNLTSDAWSKVFLPTIIFDKESVKEKLRKIKQKLTELGI